VYCPVSDRTSAQSPIERCYKRIFARPALSWSRPLVALATCPPFKRIASFWPSLGINNCPFEAFAAIGPRVRRKFHHPIGLKTIDLLWITLFPLGCGSQAKGVTGDGRPSPVPYGGSGRDVERVSPYRAWGSRRRHPLLPPRPRDATALPAHRVALVRRNSGIVSARRMFVPQGRQQRPTVSTVRPA
jgi:hypothetical protein